MSKHYIYYSLQRLKILNGVVYYQLLIYKAQFVKFLYITSHTYLMQPSHHSNQNLSDHDDYLFPLHSNLSLKDGQKNKQDRPSQENDYDNLFSQFSQPAQFNQLFNNSFNQNNNFSQINQQNFEEDSFFNDEAVGYFNQRKSTQNKPFLAKKQPKDTNKILQILKMKDGKQKQAEQKKSKNSSTYQSIQSTKNISKSLIIKPRISASRSSKSQIQPMIKLVKKRSDSTSNTSSRVKTETNQDIKYYKKAKQICKTQYDNELELQPKNNFPMIVEEQDSLQCTFKPSLLRECLKEINNIPNCNISRSKSNKPSKDVKNTQPLKIANIEKDRKSLQMPKEKVALSKKSSAQASGATLDVVSRNQLWLIQRQQRLIQRRKQEEQQKLKRQDFSFKPSINQYRKQSKPNPKQIEKEIVPPPFFQRLSMAKQKNAGIKFKKEQNIKHLECQGKQKNKENIVSFDNLEKEYSQAFKNKKQNYELAVKQLHYKIMKMNI